MTIDGYLTTKEAATEAGMKESELRAAKERLGIKVQSFGGRLMWTPGDLQEIAEFETAQRNGTCPSCGERVPYVRVKAHDA